MTYHRHSRAVTSSARWKAVRLQALRRDGFKCCECGAVGRLEVHHEKPVRHAPELSFELSNLRTLCGSCHAKITRVEIGLAGPLHALRQQWQSLVDALMPATKLENQKC